MITLQDASSGQGASSHGQDNDRQNESRRVSNKAASPDQGAFAKKGVQSSLDTTSAERSPAFRRLVPSSENSAAVRPLPSAASRAPHKDRHFLAPSSPAAAAPRPAAAASSSSAGLLRPTPASWSSPASSFRRDLSDAADSLVPAEGGDSGRKVRKEPSSPVLQRAPPASLFGKVGKF